ncbi:MAG: hypothetical protein HFJ53_07095 [Clostridia bacterium]|nr:hypothetical protein [Clostridia bacterium]
MKIKCLICGDIIESKSVHDLVSCKCESCYIDGGRYSAHIGAKDFNKIVKIFDDGTEVKGDLLSFFVNDIKKYLPNSNKQ